MDVGLGSRLGKPRRECAGARITGLRALSPATQPRVRAQTPTTVRVNDAADSTKDRILAAPRHHERSIQVRGNPRSCSRICAQCRCC